MSTVVLANGATFWFEKKGAGPPLVHIHGSAFGHKNFAKLSPYMLNDFEVIDFDLPGYGESQGGPKAENMEDLAEQVFMFIQTLGYPRVHLHGTSFGAMIGLTLAARHPEIIDRLVLSCFLARYDLAARMMRSTWKRTARESGMEAVADLTSVAGFARAYYDRPEAQDQLAAMRLAFSKTTADAFIAGTETIEKTDLSPLLDLVHTKTLLLAGAEDNMTPYHTSPSGFGISQIFQRLPSCELNILKDCGHYLVIEQPRAAADAIVSFLKE